MLRRIRSGGFRKAPSPPWNGHGGFTPMSSPSARKAKSMHFYRNALVLGLVLLAATVGQAGDDWLQFRGSDSSGVSEEEGLPISWDENEARNIAWKSELPGRGLSGPIVVRENVVLTANSGFRQDRLHVLCYDVNSGTKRWERQFWATGQTYCHPKMCMATPTPASDGERIFAFFSCNDLVCLDLDGNLLWVRGLTHDYPHASNSVGMASSPLVVDDTLVVLLENSTDSFAVGLDTKSGVNRWKIPRPTTTNWTSPVSLMGPGGRPNVVLQSSDKLTGHDPASGTQIWEYQAKCLTIPSATVASDVLYVPTDGLTALRLDSLGQPPEAVWTSKRLRPSTASPLVYRGRAYALSGSILKCAGAEKGDLLWQLRLEGPFSSSPVAAGGHLYFFNEHGSAQIVAVREEGKIVGQGALGETILCTPAIARGALFVRSDGHLWKIARS